MTKHDLMITTTKEVIFCLHTFILFFPFHSYAVGMLYPNQISLTSHPQCAPRFGTVSLKSDFETHPLEVYGQFVIRL